MLITTLVEAFMVTLRPIPHQSLNQEYECKIALQQISHSHLCLSKKVDALRLSENSTAYSVSSYVIVATLG